MHIGWGMVCERRAKSCYSDLDNISLYQRYIGSL